MKIMRPKTFAWLSYKYGNHLISRLVCRLGSHSVFLGSNEQCPKSFLSDYWSISSCLIQKYLLWLKDDNDIIGTISNSLQNPFERIEGYFCTFDFCTFLCWFNRTLNAILDKFEFQFFWFPFKEKLLNILFCICVINFSWLRAQFCDEHLK